LFVAFACGNRAARADEIYVMKKISCVGAGQRKQIGRARSPTKNDDE
jgi:hypothetical protein